MTDPGATPFRQHQATERRSVDELEPKRVRFAEFEFDLERQELRRNGVPVRLPAQPSRLLSLLVTRAGSVVTREEIQRGIWGVETFVDFEQGINHCIRQVRSALEDESESPRFIQTLPKRGYRFLVPIEEERPAAGPGPAPAWRRPLGWFTLAGVAALGLVIILLSFRSWWGPADGGTVRLRGQPKVAILPFQVLEAGTEDDYLGPAFTEELITELGRRYSGRLGVIARTTVMRYQNPAPDVLRIRRELGVDYVLEGSVRRDGERLRVTAQLIRTADHVHLWAGEYDRRMADMLDLQRDVGEQIARALALKILPTKDCALPAAATSPEAYDQYLRGRYYLGGTGSDSLGQSLIFFRKAIELDPGFAPAYAGLASALLGRPVPPRVSRPEAREAGLKAVALDDSLAEAHLLLAVVLFYYDLDPEGARREFEHALEINPVSADAHHAFAAYFSVQGRHEEALAEVQKARALDPLAPMVNSDIGWYYYFARRYNEAIQHSRRTLQISPGFYWANRCILLASIQKRDLLAAVTQAKTEMLETGAATEVLRKLEGAPLDAALREYWRWDLQRKNPGGRPRSPADRALILLALGEYEHALDELEKAYEERFGWLLPFLRVEPMADPLRGDPRFQDLLARIDHHARLPLSARR
jgi:TolB-like protein/DNA-binding winged helix-turn-helix (wHTH) protein